ncbi:hypothetical protein PoB_005320900 [Plakobranchus ocellatus]|uniref:Uncharacterized protein n=1 Tax=Plakobranchus ocellatus TaxID=259542 RepID=A0AAV4C2G0_9GAST|nr:hypothetical protein PoB_005320900 [Plakobranchus ocellatus]
MLDHEVYVNVNRDKFLAKIICVQRFLLQRTGRQEVVNELKKRRWPGARLALKKKCLQVQHNNTVIETAEIELQGKRNGKKAEGFHVEGSGGRLAFKPWLPYYSIFPYACE